MTRQEQERRRTLKKRRRHLDSIAQAIAAANPRSMSHASTRSKQAKANHIQADDLHRRRAEYDQLRQEMHAIAAELARK